jgi:hypothetical protein
MPTTTRTRTPLLALLRRQFGRSREAYVARRTLERELATFTSQSDLNDLHAVLDRYSDEQTAGIRRILSRHAG